MIKCKCEYAVNMNDNEISRNKKAKNNEKFAKRD